MSGFHGASHFSKCFIQNLLTSSSGFYQRMAKKFTKMSSFVNEKQSVHQVTVDWYSHCTSIVADSDALPHSLLASHLYSPDSLLLIFVSTRTLVLKRTWLLILIQDTISGGVPDALHDRVTLLPSEMVSFCIGCIAEGTVHDN